MATLLTPIKKHMMPGERRFVERLRDKLDASCLCWFDVRLKPTRHPDYIVFDPSHGVWTLEVKDWKPDSIISCTPQQVILRTPAGPRQDHNPLEQARTNALTVVDLLKTDPLLTEAGTGKLLFPWTFGCVLTAIPRRIFEAKGLDKIIDPNHVICQDEMAESVDPQAFHQRLLAMQPYRPAAPMSSIQIDRVRAHIFPEVRVGTQASFFDAGLIESPDFIRVMDLQQEQLARGLGDGHRIIHGVAGSGKTMILIYRALYLAELTGNPILLLCYNWPIAHHLKKIVQSRGASERVQVFHFHEWCRHLLREVGMENTIPRGKNSSDDLVEQTLKAVSSSSIPKGQYRAILIDEGHDFREHPSWFSLVLDMLDTTHWSSLVVAYDDAQSIYDRKKEKNFSFKSVGINAQGRTTVLRKNYRNTYEILNLAKAFAGSLLDGSEENDDTAPTLCPECAGRHGPAPEILRLSSFQEEADFIAKALLNAKKSGMAWKDMAVAYRTATLGKFVMGALKKHNVPFWHKEGIDNAYNPHDDSVKLITMHAIKGLEFPLVCLFGLGAMPNKERDESEEARVLYVAMTRSTDRLVMTFSHVSSFVERLLVAQETLS